LATQLVAKVVSEKQQTWPAVQSVALLQVTVTIIDGSPPSPTEAEPPEEELPEPPLLPESSPVAASEPLLLLDDDDEHAIAKATPHESSTNTFVLRIRKYLLRNVVLP
jgi:hypothetical protein